MDFMSKTTRAFLDNWTTLKDNAEAPPSESFLDNPDPAVQPHAFILELEEPDRTVFRLAATDLVNIWGKDFTGQALEDLFSPEVCARYLRQPRSCIERHCGLWERGRFGDARNREVELELLHLPLGVRKGRARRLAGCIVHHRTTAFDAARRGLIALEQRHWIDTGYGIPDEAPDIVVVVE